MKKTLGAVFFAALACMPVLSVAKTVYEAPYLTCVASYPVVSVGNAGRFHVVTNTDGPFMWVVSSENYGVYDAGTDFVTPLTDVGQQQVTAVWGSKRASCFVDVVTAPGFGEPYFAPNYAGQEYLDYSSGYGVYGPNVTLTSVAYPLWPNAGFEPQTLAALAFSFVFLLGASIAFYPHAKRLLLLSPARAPETRLARALRYVCLAVGIFVIVVALADITSRLADSALGDDALFDAFAPAAALKPAAAAVPAVQASTTGAFVPARLKVPSLGIDAKVEEVGRRADGAMGTPADFMNVGWWSEGSRPGQPGNAVFDGHVNNALTKPGVFEHLSQIKKGDYITASDAEGHTLVYEVTEVTLYGTDPAPLRKIFATTGPSRLVLITCDGEWLQNERSFDKRLVVVARPAY